MLSPESDLARGIRKSPSPRPPTPPDLVQVRRVTSRNSDLTHVTIAWPDIPTTLLRAELKRREESSSTCGSGLGRGSYNTSLHVAALILILVLSTAACSFPIIVRRFPWLPVPHHFLFLSRHFGTGVLIATAFVHLLPTAFVSLTESCLPWFWNHGYTAMAGLIAMTSVLVVVGIEMFFATRGAGHVHASEYDTVPADQDEDIHKYQETNGGFRAPRLSRRDFRQADASGVPLGLLPSCSTENLVPISPAFAPPNNTTLHKPPNLDEDDDDNDSSERTSLDLENPSPYPIATFPPSQTQLQPQQNLLLQCLLLEAGILFHSIFIGIALSVATGRTFLVLLLAISFHQTFEGLALGSRIAAIPPSIFPPSSPKPWLMALAYGTTTPLGQAIGLVVHNLYDPAGEAGLLMVGIMNAVSSGLLLFAGLVELLAEDFLSERSYGMLKGRRRIEACAAVVAGAGLMALVGAWA